MSVWLLVSLIVAGLFGAVGHEVAHWIVWWLAGRRPTLDVWRLEVCPRAGPTWTTPADRVAAAAPYVVGLSALVVAFVARDVVVGMFGLAMVQWPSRVDVAAMRGRAEWAVGENATPQS